MGACKCTTQSVQSCMCDGENAIVTDGTEPVWTLKPHGTNQLKLVSKAKHELHQGKLSGVQTELGRARTEET